MGPASQMFSIFLFLHLVLYPTKAYSVKALSYKSFQPSTLTCSSLHGDCLLHEVLNKVCITQIVFSNHILAMLIHFKTDIQILIDSAYS